MARRIFKRKFFAGALDVCKVGLILYVVLDKEILFLVNFWCTVTLPEYQKMADLFWILCKLISKNIEIKIPIFSKFMTDPLKYNFWRKIILNLKLWEYDFLRVLKIKNVYHYIFFLNPNFRSIAFTCTKIDKSFLQWPLRLVFMFWGRLNF